MIFEDDQVIDKIEIVACITMDASPSIDPKLRTNADDIRIITRTEE